MTNMNPKKETIGATVILRVLKISGLNSVTVGEPVIRINPKTIMIKPKAISKKLILPKIRRLFFSILISKILFVSN